MTIERTDLASGLTVVTEAIPGARSASFGCWVRVGGRDEPLDRAGASHFLEHLLFKGTEPAPGREISEAIEAVGGELNAHTAHEHTAFYARVPASAAQIGLDLLTDVVTTPAFDVDDVESERQVILEELHQAEDEGDDRVMSLAHEALWGDHPLGREVLGTLESIDAMDRDAIAGFFEQHYHPANLVLVAAGRDRPRPGGGGGERFPAAGGGPAPRAHGAGCCGAGPGHGRAASPARAGPPRRGLARRAGRRPDRYALSVCNQILGGGLSSRLFQEIREARGLAYSVFSSVSAYSDAGSVVAYAGTSPDRVDEVRRLILDTTAALVDQGVTHREWEVARGYLEGAALLSLEDSGSVMARLGNHVCARGSVTPLEVQLAKLRAVTPDDVHRVAQRLLAQPPAVCTVGPT